MERGAAPRRARGPEPETAASCRAQTALGLLHDFVSDSVSVAVTHKVTAGRVAFVAQASSARGAAITTSAGTSATVAHRRDDRSVRLARLREGVARDVHRQRRGRERTNALGLGVGDRHDQAAVAQNSGADQACWPPAPLIGAVVAVVPIGYLVTTALMGLCTAFALAPPRPRQSSPSKVSYWFGYLLNELPFVAFYWLLASTLLAVGQGDIDSPVGWVAFGLAVLTTVGLVVVAWRGLQARPARRQRAERGPRC